MTRAVVALAAVAALGMTGAADTQAAGKFQRFKGTWIGHTRSLVIYSDGRAVESINDGCCTHAFTLHLRLYAPHGSAVHVRVVGVQQGEYDAPRVGKRGVLRLRNGVIDESITKTDYCGSGARAGACGA
jgi:hypothetical protein